MNTCIKKYVGLMLTQEDFNLIINNYDLINKELHKVNVSETLDKFGIQALNYIKFNCGKLTEFKIYPMMKLNVKQKCMFIPLCQNTIDELDFYNKNFIYAIPILCIYDICDYKILKNNYSSIKEDIKEKISSYISPSFNYDSHIGIIAYLVEKD